MLIEATINARDADPVAPIAVPIYLERCRPFVMTANILGSDDRNRQNLGVRRPAPAHHSRRCPSCSISVSITTKSGIIHVASIGSSWR